MRLPVNRPTNPPGRAVDPPLGGGVRTPDPEVNSHLLDHRATPERPERKKGQEDDVRWVSGTSGRGAPEAKPASPLPPGEVKLRHPEHQGDGLRRSAAALGGGGRAGGRRCPAHSRWGPPGSLGTDTGISGSAPRGLERFAAVAGLRVAVVGADGAEGGEVHDLERSEQRVNDGRDAALGAIEGGELLVMRCR